MTRDEAATMADWERPQFTRPGRAQAGLQWKGTDVCLDVTCQCGAESHLDGYIFGKWRCGACGLAFQLPHLTITAYEIEGTGSETLAPDERGDT